MCPSVFLGLNLALDTDCAQASLRFGLLRYGIELQKLFTDLHLREAMQLGGSLNILSNNTHDFKEKFFVDRGPTLGTKGLDDLKGSR